jgi:hypothetical protein
MSNLKHYIAESLEALHTKQLIDYNREAEKIIERILDPSYKPKKIRVKKNYTKVESYHQFQQQFQTETYQAIYAHISKSECPISRNDIANALDMRIQTVCARIAEMLEAEAVTVVGTKIDSDTKRKVEIIEVTI